MVVRVAETDRIKYVWAHVRGHDVQNAVKFTEESQFSMAVEVVYGAVYLGNIYK
jgi:hypothetical protein